MKSIIKSVAVFGMLLGSLTFASQFPIYFQQTSGTVKEFTPSANSELSLANAAFLVKYGKDTGVLGTGEGVSGELLVWVSDMQVATVVWNKMVLAGDGISEGGVGYIRFNAPPVAPSTPFKLVGRISVPENTLGKFFIVNGTPLTKNVLLVMDRSCSFSHAQFETINNVPVLPAQFVKSVLTAGNGIAYEYNINGGSGALLSSVIISMGHNPFPGPFVKICPVDIYFK